MSKKPQGTFCAKASNINQFWWSFHYMFVYHHIGGIGKCFKNHFWWLMTSFKIQKEGYFGYFISPTFKLLWQDFFTDLYFGFKIPLIKVICCSNFFYLPPAILLEQYHLRYKKKPLSFLFWLLEEWEYLTIFQNAAPTTMKVGNWKFKNRSNFVKNSSLEKT